MTQDIGELERRISAAFDRMDRGLDALARARLETGAASEGAPNGAPDAVPDAVPDWAAPLVLPPSEFGPQMATVLRALETAKAASDDWAARYSKLQAQTGEDSLAMAAEIARLTAELDAARTGAAPQGAAPPPPTERDDEIDELTARLAAQEAELETLRAARAADASELGELIAQLAPLVEEASHV